MPCEEKRRLVPGARLTCHVGIVRRSGPGFRRPRPTLTGGRDEPDAMKGPLSFLRIFVAVSKKARFECFKRDKFTCQYCGRRPPDVMLEADHIVARSVGGPDSVANLTTSCFECNRGKSDRDLGDTAPALGEDERLEALQEMLERKRDIEGQIEIAAGLRESEDRAIQHVRSVYEDLNGIYAFEPESVRQFLARGLSVDDLRQAAHVVAGREFSGWKGWRYFCGICWRMIKDRREPLDA